MFISYLQGLNHYNTCATYFLTPYIPLWGTIGRTTQLAFPGARTLRIRVVLTSLKIRRIVQVARDPTRQRTERKLTKSSRLTPEATLPKVFSANARSNQSHQSSRLTPEAKQTVSSANARSKQTVFSANARSKPSSLLGSRQKQTNKTYPLTR